MAVLLLLALLVIVALAIEASNLYVVKLRQQHVATLATLAAASTPGPVVNGAPSAGATAAARNIAAINGISPSDLALSAAAGPSGPQITARVASAIPITIGALLTKATSVLVAASSSATASSVVAGDCVRSLVLSVDIHDFARLEGPNCTIASNTHLLIADNATVNAAAAAVGVPQFIEYAFMHSFGAVTPNLSNGTFKYSVPSTDPLGGDPRTTALWNRLQGMAAWPFGRTGMLVRIPPVGLSKTYTSTTAALNAATRYGSLTVTNAVLNMTSSGAADPACNNPLTISGSLYLYGTNTLSLGSGCYVIGGSILNQAGARTAILPTPGANVTLVLNGSIVNASASLTFGDMSRWIAGSITNIVGGSITFGNGQFVLIGSIGNAIGTLSFGNGPFYFTTGSISNYSSASLSFGDGPFYFDGGSITNTSARLSFGRGDFNFYLGSLILNTGSVTRFGPGNLSFYGGSATFIGASVTLGAGGDPVNGSSGLYFFGGSLAMTGGSLTARGTTIGLRGGLASFLGAATLTLTAPTGSNPGYGYQDILFYSTLGPITIAPLGTANILSGTVYDPLGIVSVYGNHTVAVPDGGCLSVIGGFVNIFQWANLTMKPCGASTGSSTVRLTQ